MIGTKNAGVDFGARYDWTDKTVTRGKTFFYQLEVVGAQGAFEWSKPLKVDVSLRST